MIVGLGNPGALYRDTRHSVGFTVIDELARRVAATFESAPGDTLMARLREPSPGAWLVKPLTYMNLSGPAVAGFARYFKIDLADLLVIADDVNLPLGRLRARARGSAGGHKGIKSIIDALATEEFARLRLGVGRGDPRRDLADHVLAHFDPDERVPLDQAIVRAADAATLFVTDGIDRVMTTFNRADADRSGDDQEEGHTA